MALSPYGSPPVEIGMQFGAHMKDWSGTDADWDQFFGDLVRDIADAIWPEWRVGTGWVGGASSFFEDATRAELEIHVNTVFRQDYLAKTPDYISVSGDLPLRDHFWLYALEDDINIRLPKFAQNHQGRYGDPTQTETELAKFGLASFAYYDAGLLDGRPFSAYKKMFTHKYEGLYQTKLAFRRPRPQQAAFALDVQGFAHRQALWSVHTGNHPSLISGHCLQGFLLACTLIEQSLEDGVLLKDMPLPAYRQYAADVGDRRVFAGVHYFTDNFASWITALRVIPWVFKKDSELYLQFVADAIRTNSAIYAIASQTFPGDAWLDNAWQLLSAELDKVPVVPLN